MDQALLNQLVIDIKAAKNQEERIKIASSPKYKTVMAELMAGLLLAVVKPKIQEYIEDLIWPELIKKVKIER